MKHPLKVHTIAPRGQASRYAAFASSRRSQEAPNASARDPLWRDSALSVASTENATQPRPPRRFAASARLATVIAIAALAPLACGPAGPLRSPVDSSNTLEAWNAINDPLNMRSQYVVRLADLPLDGELQRKPWTDTYWPNYEGGLANRWNDPTGPDAFTYELYDEADIRLMSPEKLAQLSPAEKYDILRGDFTYPLVAYERERTHPDDPGWYGLCHGWAPAAVNFEEPDPVVVPAANGVNVPFGSSDVKALLLFAQQGGPDSRSAGDRCNFDDPSHARDPACRDINAGSFHVILANQIGLLQTGFVAEITAAAEVWNQPVYGFEAVVLDPSMALYPSAAQGTVRIVKMRTSLRYIQEMSPQWDPRPFSRYPEQGGERRYDYTLELNADGEIIGGEWVSADHPDFVWTQGAPRLTGYFEELEDLYEAATRD